MINTLESEMNCFYDIHNEQYQINFIKDVFCKKSNSLKFNHFDSNVSMLSDISLDINVKLYENQAPIVRTLFDCLVQRSQEDESIKNRQKRKFCKCLAIELLISANNLVIFHPCLLLLYCYCIIL